MSTSCTVVIAPAYLMQSVCERLRSTSVELVPCVETDIPVAIATIVQRRPATVAIERVFASTSRGAALVGRLKADPAIVDIEIRIVAHDSDYSRVSPRRPAGDAADGGVAVAAPAPVLDQHGTRRAARTAIVESAEILVDGDAVRLVDLSVLGAQVLSPAALRPGQRVRVSMVDEKLTLRFQATVIWATFELPGGGTAPRYRAGIEFSGADAAGIGEYAARHLRRDNQVADRK
jgi:PilZ domain